MAQHVMVRVDAARFEKRIGDAVRKGETLGEWNGQPVCAPVDGRVESVAFDPEEHSLIVTLESGENSPNDQQDWTVLSLNADQVSALTLGAQVKRGTALGCCFGRTVRAPFDAIIDHVSFNIHNQTVLITLVQPQATTL